ncbi:hypothetical protein ACN27G_05515 [Plantactinospora sp. WMMB334]|uniref:hypothetical protein n=1 Tax=Plantactinospora sp. WMMB334 TaxID=3404119 RepID=UPI003B925F98
MNPADGPPGLAIDTAQRIVLGHATDPPAPCTQCRERRCWLLETAVKVVAFAGEPIDPTLYAAITTAARRIADVHAPGDDRLCSPCLLEECEPLEIATAWLHVAAEQTAAPRTVVDVLTPDLDEARRVVRQHQGYGCPQCTPTGCPAEDAAVPVVFDDVAGRWPSGPKTLDEVERIAREMRGGSGLTTPDF